MFTTSVPSSFSWANNEKSNKPIVIIKENSMRFFDIFQSVFCLSLFCTCQILKTLRDGNERFYFFVFAFFAPSRLSLPQSRKEHKGFFINSRFLRMNLFPPPHF